MKKRSPKPRWAIPSVAADRRALRKYYTEEYLVHETDKDGLGPAAITKLAELAKVLEQLKRRPS